MNECPHHLSVPFCLFLKSHHFGKVTHLIILYIRPTIKQQDWEWDRQSMMLTRPTFALLIQKITSSNLRTTLTSSFELACGPNFRWSLMVSLTGPPTTI